MDLSNARLNQLTYSIPEELYRGAFVGDVFNDSNLKSHLTFNEEFIDFKFLKNPRLPLSIDSKTGIIETTDQIDRENICLNILICEDTLDIVITSNASAYFLEILKVNIEVTDVNDNKPMFLSGDNITINISESKEKNSRFILPTAIDKDSSIFGVKSYHLIGYNSLFRLEVVERVDSSIELKLVLKSRLDREKKDFYQMELQAMDGGIPPLVGKLTIFINVIDINDNEPIFDSLSYNVNISENQPVGSQIIQVSAHDSDGDVFGLIEYGFSRTTSSKFGHIFSIDKSNGIIKLKTLLNYADNNIFKLVITASNNDANYIPTDTLLTIYVQDINDNPPKIKINSISSLDTDSVYLPENSSLNNFVAYVTVFDPDSNQGGEVACFLNSDDKYFYMEKQYEKEYSIYTKEILDREHQFLHELLIECSDHGDPKLTSKKMLFVYIVDENDNQPVFSHRKYKVKLLENQPSGTFILQVNATDLDEGLNSQLKYSLKPKYIQSCCISVDSSTGVVRSKKSFDYETNKNFTFSIIAEDGGTPPMKGRTVVHLSIIDVNDESPKFMKNFYKFSIFENSVINTAIGTVMAVDNDSHQFNKLWYVIVPAFSSKKKFYIDRNSGLIKSNYSFDREEQQFYDFDVIATDLVSTNLSGSAYVSVEILDLNDNAPLIEYPSDFNSTVTISSETPKDYVITEIKAVDFDAGQNAFLKFYIAGGNEKKNFAINPLDGILYVQKPLHNSKLSSCCDVFNLIIVVEDSGSPKQEASLHINIITNSSVPAPYRNEKSKSSMNMILITFIVTITSIVIIILIILICITHKKGSKPKKYHYMEAEKVCITSCNSKGLNSLQDLKSTVIENGTIPESVTDNNVHKCQSYIFNHHNFNYPDDPKSHSMKKCIVEDGSLIKCPFNKQDSHHSLPRMRKYQDKKTKHKELKSPLEELQFCKSDSLVDLSNDELKRNALFHELHNDLDENTSLTDDNPMDYPDYESKYIDVNETIKGLNESPHQMKNILFPRKYSQISFKKEPILSYQYNSLKIKSESCDEFEDHIKKLFDKTNKGSSEEKLSNTRDEIETSTNKVLKPNLKCTKPLMRIDSSLVSNDNFSNDKRFRDSTKIEDDFYPFTTFNSNYQTIEMKNLNNSKDVGLKKAVLCNNKLNNNSDNVSS